MVPYLSTTTLSHNSPGWIAMLSVPLSFVLGIVYFVTGRKLAKFVHRLTDISLLMNDGFVTVTEEVTVTDERRTSNLQQQESLSELSAGPLHDLLDSCSMHDDPAYESNTVERVPGGTGFNYPSWLDKGDAPALAKWGRGSSSSSSSGSDGDSGLTLSGAVKLQINDETDDVTHDDKGRPPGYRGSTACDRGSTAGDRGITANDRGSTVYDKGSTAEDDRRASRRRSSEYSYMSSQQTIFRGASDLVAGGGDEDLPASGAGDGTMVGNAGNFSTMVARVGNKGAARDMRWGNTTSRESACVYIV
jgi:hypothetical protein